ncbi:MAG: hypothetical protein AAF654_01255 [Myxococcota bacterium]
MVAPAVHSASQIRYIAPESPINTHAPLMSIAQQTMATVAGAQSAYSGSYPNSSWDARSMTATVRADLDGFTGTYRGDVRIGFRAIEGPFTPDSEPATVAAAATSGKNPPVESPAQELFARAAAKTMARLAGAQAAGQATYQLTSMRGDSTGVSGTVRVDLTGFTGTYRGEVAVRLEKVSALFKPDPEPAADAFERV